MSTTMHLLSPLRPAFRRAANQRGRIELLLFLFGAFYRVPTGSYAIQLHYWIMYTALRRSSSAKEEGWGEWGEWREGGTRIASLLSLRTTWKGLRRNNGGYWRF
ncbi:hypothetical protein EV426DRAFT_712535 [Tirmania nivea]|nr:hypothetical protein EV426DRAFT_712535 [Tirmania nivea]